MFKILNRTREDKSEQQRTHEPLFSAPSTPERANAERRLNALIAKGANGHIHVERMTVSPLMAELMLGHNTGNRPVREQRVEAFADIIKSGRWIVMLQGISFAADGTLNNGQHRLRAIVESGRSVDVIVAFGEPREAFAVTDTQATRGGADILAIEGEKNTVALAAACQMLNAIECGAARANGATAYRLTNDQLLSFLDQHPTIRASVPIGAQTSQALRCSAAAMIVAHYFAAQKDLPRADLFFDTLKTGVGLPSQRHPIYRLRERLRNGQRARPIMQCALTMKAWNAYRTNEPMRQLGWREDEAFPVAE